MKNFTIKLRSLTTCEPYRERIFQERSTGSIHLETTPLGISGGYLGKRIVVICDVLSGLTTRVKRWLQESLRRVTSPDTYRNKLLDLLNTASPERRFLKENREAAVPVYDIVNAGPLHRFCTVNHVAHNCLALGYGAGWKKFIEMAAMYIQDEVIFNKIFKANTTKEEEDAFYDYLKFLATKFQKRADFLSFPNLDAETKKVWVNSWKQVNDYRKNNPNVVGLWKRLQGALDRTISSDLPELFLKLPSGRKLRYHNFSKFDNSGEVIYGVRKKLYSGILVENLSQATARDIFGECILRMEAEGFPVIWTVHDEVIAEVPEDTSTDDVHRAFAQPPDWLPDFPFEAEGGLTDHYTK